jgi:glycosyltransferase involved in cell wall biosynthesis
MSEGPGLAPNSSPPPTQPPRVSVVVPAYNAQRYLIESINSVLAQTFRDFECIVVDDGSTDRTPQLIDELARVDSRIRRLTIPHGGIVKGLNAGIEAARGQYIARTDADDICLPNRFELQVRYLDQHPDCVMIGSKVTLVDPYNSNLWEVDVQSDHEAIEADLLRGNGWAVIHPSTMLRREAVLQAGGYRAEYEWAEDLDLFLRMGLLGRLANLQDSLLHYRQHFASVNRTRWEAQNERTRLAVLDAYRLRGKPAPEGFKPQVGISMTRLEQTHAWCLRAMYIKNWKAARRHAMAIVRAQPARLDSWKMLAHALIKR